MKRTPFIAILVLTLVLEAGMCILLTTRVKEPETDTVAVNEVLHSVSENFGDPSKYDRQIDYVVTDEDGAVLFKTREDLDGSVNGAIKARSLMLDIRTDGKTVGKLIISTDVNRQLEDARRDIIIICGVMTLIQTAVVIFWYVYMNRTITAPFKKLLGFAARVSEGNLDIPLEMDRSHAFGEFTEAFDLMRSQLKKARIAEKKASDDKKEMVAKLSHDIKTPVASIKSTSEIGLELTKEARTREMFGVINTKTDQIRTLVDNLFNSSVKDIVDIEVNPGLHDSEDVREIIANSDYLGRTEKIVIPACTVYMDKLRLQQVFDNIFMNSYKYADTRITVDASVRDGLLAVSVADEGPGVSDSELPLLKEKYKRGSNTQDKDGAGLGLFLADHFMKKMDGELKLRNLEKGFEVAVLLRIV